MRPKYFFWKKILKERLEEFDPMSPSKIFRTAKSYQKEILELFKPSERIRTEKLVF
jgi:hypothetical protein